MSGWRVVGEWLDENITSKDRLAVDIERRQRGSSVTILLDSRGSIIMAKVSEKRITSYFLHHVINLPKEAEILSVYEQDGRLKIDVIEDGSSIRRMRFFTVCDTTTKTVVPAGAQLVGVAVLSDGSRYLFEVPQAPAAAASSTTRHR